MGLLALGSASLARADDDTPQLMLDTGGHMAAIKGLVFTPDGNQLVSAGDDKVIRVWDWRAGKTVRTIRGESGPGDYGKIYAMALSPDGRWLAVAGWMSSGRGNRDDEFGVIRIYDFAKGKLVALLRGHVDAVTALAFSPDGKQLISGSFDEQAILWDPRNAKLLRRLNGHKEPILGVSFVRDGARVVTASGDKTLKLWSTKDGKEIATLRGHRGDIDALAVSATDGTIASGSSDGEVRVWDGKNGRFLRTVAKQNSGIIALRFSPNGKWLLSTSAEPADGQHIWDVVSGAEVVAYTNHDNTVFAGAFSPDGRMVATAGGNNKQINLWDPATGETKQVLVGTGASKWSVGFSADGQHLAWRSLDPCPSRYCPNASGTLEYQLALPGPAQHLAAPEPIDASRSREFTRGQSVHANYALSLRTGSAARYDGNILDLTKDGLTDWSVERKSSNGFRHSAYTFTPDGLTIVSGGGNGQLTAYDLTGKSLGNFVGHQNDLWAVTPSSDARLLISGAADQTVRLWNLATRELIVTLFHGRDGEWVMWTPQGYYVSSPGGEKIVGWQINKGADQAAEYVTANQLRDHFYRPDIVERAIVLASAMAAVAQARGTNFALAELLTRRPPVFDIVSPEDKSHAPETSAEVRLKLEPNADPIEAIEVLVNGRQTTTPALRNATARWATSVTPERSIEVPLEEGENRIRVVARNKVGQTVREFVLFRDKPEPPDSRGKLYVLAIGVDKYPHLPATCGAGGNEPCDLRYAGDDARAFRDVLVKSGRPLYREVATLLLAQGGDKPPTKANIEDALGEFFRQAKREDTSILFIAGHGVNDAGGDYLFMPEDAEASASGWRNSTVLSWTILQKALHTAEGRRLMFADTCHSGAAYNPRLVNDAANANIVVFSATDTKALSWELERLKHGVFTYALIQGLEGKARGADGVVTMLGLAAFISAEVAKITDKKQKPNFNMSGAEDFTMAQQ